MQFTSTDQKPCTIYNYIDTIDVGNLPCGQTDCIIV